MSKQNNFEQKVKITILESFESKLLHKYLEDERGGLNLGVENQAFLDVVIGKHGKEIHASITPDGMLAVVSPETDSGFVMVGFEFIDMDKIYPVGTIFTVGKMYKLVDQDNKFGIFVKMSFNKDKKVMEYTLVSTDASLTTGTIMSELTETELDIFSFGSHESYYAKA